MFGARSLGAAPFSHLASQNGVFMLLPTAITIEVNKSASCNMIFLIRCVIITSPHVCSSHLLLRHNDNGIRYLGKTVISNPVSNLPTSICLFCNSLVWICHGNWSPLSSSD
jgi:hypothetical protein